jgi:hypothetical protein
MRSRDGFLSITRLCLSYLCMNYGTIVNLGGVGSVPVFLIDRCEWSSDWRGVQFEDRQRNSARFETAARANKRHFIRSVPVLLGNQPLYADLVLRIPVRSRLYVFEAHDAIAEKGAQHRVVAIGAVFVYHNSSLA